MESLAVPDVIHRYLNQPQNASNERLLRTMTEFFPIFVNNEKFFEVSNSDIIKILRKTTMTFTPQSASDFVKRLSNNWC